MKALIVLALFVLGCDGCTKPFPPTPPPAPIATCDAACANLVRLDCGTDTGICRAMCAKIIGNNTHFAGCIAAASSCKEANDCDSMPVAGARDGGR